MLLHTVNVARGGKLSFQNVGGGKGVYNVLTLQKSRGARANLGGGKGPLNAALQMDLYK